MTINKIVQIPKYYPSISIRESTDSRKKTDCPIEIGMIQKYILLHYVKQRDFIYMCHRDADGLIPFLSVIPGDVVTAEQVTRRITKDNMFIVFQSGVAFIRSCLSRLSDRESTLSNTVRAHYCVCVCFQIELSLQ